MAPAPGALAATAEALPPEAGALQRSLALIGLIIAQERPLSAAEIADLSGLTPSTAHRLLQTLVQAGYLLRDASKRYLPGVPAISPLGVYHPLNALRRNSAARLRQLRDGLGLTVALIVYLGRQRLVVELIPGSDPFSPYYQTYLGTPLHASVSGKLLLSSLPPAARGELLGPPPYPAMTARTIRQPAALARELDEVAARGHAGTFDEVYQGMSAVGAAIAAASGKPLGAIVVSGPSGDFTADRTAEFVRAVKDTAALFSNASPDIKSVARFLGL